MMVISEHLTTNPIILSVTSKENYNDAVALMQGEIKDVSEKIGYVTINRPYNTIIKDLKNAGIDSNKFFFIDAITATVQSPPQVDNCIFVSSPSALTDLGLAFSSTINEQNSGLVVFDTISTLLVYQNLVAVTKFVHNIVTKARVQGKKIVLVALKEDSEEFIKDLNMFVDKIVEI
jgi:hypothetical protein